MQLLRKSLQCRARSVHHAIKRIVNNRHELFLKSQLFPLSSMVVVHFNPDMSGIPIQDATDSNRTDVVSLSHVGVDIRIYGNDRDCALFKQSEDKILEEPSSCLVDIGTERHAVIKITINVALEVTVIICPNMSDGNIRNVDSNLVVDSW